MGITVKTEPGDSSQTFGPINNSTLAPDLSEELAKTQQEVATLRTQLAAVTQELEQLKAGYSAREATLTGLSQKEAGLMTKISPKSKLPAIGGI